MYRRRTIFDTNRQVELDKSKKRVEIPVVAPVMETDEEALVREPSVVEDTGTRMYECREEDCDKSYKSESALNRHITSKHGDEENAKIQEGYRTETTSEA